MSKKKEALEADLALDLNELFAQLGGIDLGKLDEEKERKALVEKLATDPTLKRNKKGATGLGRTAKPKVHWKKKLKHRKQVYQQWYESTGKPRRDSRKLEQLQTAEGWYEHITLRWKTMTYDVGPKAGEKLDFFSFAEFLETFWPMIRDEHCLPTFRRYDTRTGGFTLDNVYVIDVRTGDVCWDSAEERLRSLGYAL